MATQTGATCHRTTITYNRFIGFWDADSKPRRKTEKTGAARVLSLLCKKKYVRYQTMESNCDFDPDKLRSILFSLDCCLIYFNNGIQVVPVSNKILV